jgi:hypothetical protein
MQTRVLRAKSVTTGCVMTLFSRIEWQSVAAAAMESAQTVKRISNYTVKSRLDRLKSHSGPDLYISWTAAAAAVATI